MIVRMIARTAQRGVFFSQISLTWLHAGWIAALIAVVSEFVIDGMHSFFGFLSERQWMLAHKYIRRLCLMGMVACVACAAYHFGECLSESLHWHPLTAHGLSFTLHAVLTWALEIPREL